MPGSGAQAGSHNFFLENILQRFVSRSLAYQLGRRYSAVLFSHHRRAIVCKDPVFYVFLHEQNTVTL